MARKRKTTEASRVPNSDEIPEAPRPEAAETEIKPDKQEDEAIIASLRRFAQRRQRLQAKVTQGDRTTVGSLYESSFGSAGFSVRMADAFGTTSQDFAWHGVEQLIAVVKQPKAAAPTQRELNAALAAVDGVEPRDEVEAQLATQMAAAHHLAMEMAMYAKQADNLPALESYGALAVKLLSLYPRQMEALAKYRSGGQQKVTVEHVHVHSGGQAVVGDVTHVNAQGGGGRDGKRDQPHGPTLEFQPVAPVWGEDATRDAVPTPCPQGPAPLQTPRVRTRRRSSKGSP